MKHEDPRKGHEDPRKGHEDPRKGHEDPRREDELYDGEIDAQWLALFRRVEAPAPSSAFIARTLRAVRQEPLPIGRRPLRNPLVLLLGWAALITGVALFGFGIAAGQPLFAWLFTALITGGFKAGMWLVQLSGAGAGLLDVLTTTGVAVSKAAVTREGVTGLLLVAALGVFSLSALRRLLISDWEGSPWQEVS